MTRTHISVNTTTTGTKGTVSVGKGTFYMPPMEESTKQDQKAGVANREEESDCPEGWVSIPVNEVVEDEGIGYTDCRSFEYWELGGTGTIVAGVEGIYEVVTRGSNCPGVGAAYSPNAYYFSLPSSRYFGSRAKRASAIALENAFKRLKTYFGNKPCKTQLRIGELGQKMHEYIQDEFRKLGGAASKNPPLGWSGEVQDYESNVGLSTPDC